MSKIKWLKGLSYLFAWLPLVILVVGIDPDLVKDVGWPNSYLPLGLSLWLGLEVSLRKVVKVRWKRWITESLIIMMIYLQIWRMSNWFEIGLGIVWLYYLTN